MTTDSWHKRPAGLLIPSVLCPPLGLILLWARSGTGIRKKLLGSLGIVVLSVAYLHLIFGIRVEVDGSGTFPIVSLYKADSHFKELEQSRIEQGKEPLESPVPPARLEQKAETRQELAEARPEASMASLPAKESPAVAQPFWTDFRGPKRDGRYDEMGILTDWPSSGLPLLWRQPIGGGYASFVVANGKAYTIEQRRNAEVVAAYEVRSGRELWKDSWPAEFREAMGGDGPRATPTWDAGRLYALGATGELRCLEADTGKVLWSRNILSDNQASNLTWGMAASPLVVEEKVIVLPGGPSGKSVVAYDKLTGKPIWKAQSDRQAYTSPMLVTLAGKRQILVVSAERALGLTVEDGALLWDYPWVTSYGINAAQPIIVGESRVLLSAGYDHGAALVEISQTERGFEARRLWENNQLKNKFSSSVLHEGHIYGLDERILTCIDVETGERRWKGGRYGYGQLLLASGHLIVLTESGDLALVKATPERH
ncbi:MAG: PQQ-like beta-propeller repeat protein, partial [Acidobacteria bacterium]|nr:PQQ-like beta-propeller repeat protein [Acidobacteriota bacterium]